MSSRNICYKVQYGLVALALSAPVSSVLAQEKPIVTLPPMTIEATKRPQDPMTVDGMTGIVDAELLEPNNFIYVNQLDRVFPDVVIRQRSSTAYSNITIRGLSSTDFYTPTVQLLVDGIPQDPSLYGILLPAGLKQAELLYGPQGTLYGASAVGGVLNIVTIKPDDKLRGVLTGAYGNLDRDVRLLLNAPIIPGYLYGDVAINFHKQKGQYKIPITGKKTGDNDHRSMRFRLRYAPKGSPLDVMIYGAHLTLKSDEEQYVSEKNFSSRTIFPTLSFYKMKTTSIGARVSYDFGSVTLTALTGYQNRNFDRTIFNNYTPEKQRSFSQEVRLTSNRSSRRTIDFVLGAYFQSVDFERRIASFFQTSKHKIYTYAGFGELVWHVTPKLDITAGLRLQYEAVKIRGVGPVTYNERENYFGFSPKFAIGYQLNKNTRIYGLFSTGYKPGGFTRNITSANIAFSFDPQISYNGEIGIKAYLFDRRLRLSLSGYYTYTKDYQLFVGLQPFQYLQNAGDVSTFGMNLRFTAQPFAELRITGGLGVSNSRFVSYENPAAPGVDFSGNRLPYAPTVTANLQAEYRFDLPGGLGQLTPRVNMSYFGRTYFDETNTIGQNSYVLFGAGLTWAVGKHFKLDAYIDNITDKTYTTYGFDGGPFLGKLYQLGAGRNFGVRMTLKF